MYVVNHATIFARWKALPVCRAYLLFVHILFSSGGIGTSLLSASIKSQCGLKRFRFTKEATCTPGSHGLLFEKLPDLELVKKTIESRGHCSASNRLSARPFNLCVPGNVIEAPVKHLRTEPQHAAAVQGVFDCLRTYMKGHCLSTFKNEMTPNREMV